MSSTIIPFDSGRAYVHRPSGTYPKRVCITDHLKRTDEQKSFLDRFESVFFNICNSDFESFKQMHDQGFSEYDASSHGRYKVDGLGVDGISLREFAELRAQKLEQGSEKQQQVQKIIALMEGRIVAEEALQQRSESPVSEFCFLSVVGKNEQKAKEILSRVLELSSSTFDYMLRCECSNSMAQQCVDKVSSITDENIQVALAFAYNDQTIQKMLEKSPDLTISFETLKKALILSDECRSEWERPRQALFDNTIQMLIKRTEDVSESHLQSLLLSSQQYSDSTIQLLLQKIETISSTKVLHWALTEHHCSDETILLLLEKCPGADGESIKATLLYNYSQKTILSLAQKSCSISQEQLNSLLSIVFSRYSSKSPDMELLLEICFSKAAEITSANLEALLAHECSPKLVESALDHALKLDSLFDAYKPLCQLLLLTQDPSLDLVAKMLQHTKGLDHQSVVDRLRLYGLPKQLLEESESK